VQQSAAAGGSWVDFDAPIFDSGALPAGATGRRPPRRARPESARCASESRPGCRDDVAIRLGGADDVGASGCRLILYSGVGRKGRTRNLGLLARLLSSSWELALVVPYRRLLINPNATEREPARPRAGASGFLGLARSAGSAGRLAPLLFAARRTTPAVPRPPRRLRVFRGFGSLRERRRRRPLRDHVGPRQSTTVVIEAGSA